MATFFGRLLSQMCRLFLPNFNEMSNVAVLRLVLSKHHSSKVFLFNLRKSETSTGVLSKFGEKDASYHEIALNFWNEDVQNVWKMYEKACIYTMMYLYRDCERHRFVRFLMLKRHEKACKAKLEYNSVELERTQISCARQKKKADYGAPFRRH